MIPKISVYFYLFNAKVRDFDLDGTINNFTEFFDEVVVSTIKSQDDTYDRLKSYEENLGGKLKVVMTDIELSDNRFDGKLKTAALKACTPSSQDNPRVYVIADADERFPISQKPRWEKAASELFLFPKLDGWLIPVVDLYGSEEHIRSDHQIGLKFRMHKDNVKSRGVIPQAELADGLFRTDMSDSTEPLNSLGELASFVPYVDSTSVLNPNFTSSLNYYPFVLHYGYLDLSRRARIGKEFWEQHWKNRSGKDNNVVIDENVLREAKVIKHKLSLK